MARELKAKDIKLTNLVDALNEGDVEVIKFVARRQPMTVLFLAGLTAEQRNVFKGFPDFFSIRRLETAASGTIGDEDEVETEEEVEEEIVEKAPAKKAAKKPAKKAKPEPEEDEDEDEEDEPAPKKGKKGKKAPAKKPAKKVVEEDDDDDDDDFDDFE